MRRGIVLLLAVVTACSTPTEHRGAAPRHIPRPATTGTTATAEATTAAPAPAATTPSPAPTTAGPQTSAAGPTATPPSGPADPAAVAAQLARTETELRSPATATADLPAVSLRQQVAYRQLAAHPEWLAAVLDRVPSALRPVVDANAQAGMELRALTRPRPALPPWRIVPAAPADELLRDYKEAQSTYGISWWYLAAIHLVETRMGRIRGPSSAGALGPMQFLPRTWAAYGRGDINSNHDAILAAARYLQANGGPANMAAALFRYNHSSHYVRAITLYAEQMRAHERAYLGYYHWQVFYLLATGDVLLPVGYGT